MKTIETKIPRFMLVGSGSDSGKTTITCAILRAMQRSALNPVSFKCGPDYIDPMFHTKALGIKSRNLDLYLCGEKAVKYLLAKNSKGAGVSIIEGVMGMYDGIGTDDTFSSNHLARITQTPEVLIINPKGMSLSLLAQIYGYMHFKPNNIKGVILNKTKETMYPMYKEMIENNLNIKVYGYMPIVENASFPDRHLGLVTAGEIDNINRKLNLLADTCAKTIDLKALLKLSEKNSDFTYEEIEINHQSDVRIAVASDNAFSFYYEDNFDLLRSLGATTEFFSPLKDKTLPKDIHGIIIGGGYPEEYAEKLSKNTAIIGKLHEYIVKKSIPTIAECGGFMYLGKSITDFQNKKYAMVNAIDTDSFMTDKLMRFGYVKLTAQNDNLLCDKGDFINAHEFHYSDSNNNGSDFLAQKESGRSWNAIHASQSLFAGYPHMHLWGNINFAKKFIKKCEEFKNGFKK